MEVGMILAIKKLAARPEPLVKVYEEFLDDAVHGEQLGFDFAWTSEHHFWEDCWSPSQMPILANLAARTSRMRLGTNVFLMPFHHPLRVAEDVATVDILSNGRLDLCSGSGSVRDEFDTFGLDPKTRWGRLFEAMALIRRCYTEEQFDHEGKYWQFPNVRMTTRPVQDPFPLWIGGFGPQLMTRAGKGGYHAQGGGPFRPKYLEGLQESGFDPADFNWQGFTSIHMAPTTEQAWDECQEAIHAWQHGYAVRDWIAMTDAGNEPPPLPPAEELRNLPQGLFWNVGTPDEVYERLKARLEHSDMTHFGCAFRPGGGMNTERVRWAIDTFARDILPEMKTWGRDAVGTSRAAPA